MQKIDQAQIQCELIKLNIPFDMSVIQQVDSFLDKYIGPLTTEQARYHIPAACAIICQTIKMPTIYQSQLTGTGVRIENVMRHIDNLSKEKFLDTIQSQVVKSNFYNHSLIEKVGKIKISFRVFKKFKSAFEKLATLNQIPMNINHDLVSLFWIIFLIVKSRLDALNDLSLSTKLLALIIEEVFCNYYGKQSPASIREFLNQKDNFASLQDAKEEEDFQIRLQIQQIFARVLKNRNPNATPFKNNLLKTPALLTRIIDDLNTEYEKIYLEFPQNRFIDQMTFLELSKDLTPQSFSNKSGQKPISSVLTFNENEEDLPKTEMKKSIFIEAEVDENIKSLSMARLFSFTENDWPLDKPAPLKKLVQKKKIQDYTPVSLGQSKQFWARSLINSYESQFKQRIVQHVESKGKKYQQFCQQASQKIQNQINQLTQYRSKKQNQIAQTLTMSLCLGSSILLKNTQISLINPSYYNALLCISSYLYNTTTRHLSLELHKYCSEYKADLIQCLFVLYDINCIDRLDVLVLQILQDLQRQILIKQIWDNECGYLLINEEYHNMQQNENNLSVSASVSKNKAIIVRLERRIYERIQDICQAIKVQPLQVTKIESLVQEIMKKRTSLLINNKLDQIIICSILACLNLNQAKYNLALSTIFQKYNTIPLSMQTNREVGADNVTQLTLLDFYNQVFIQAVQDMMSLQHEQKYLYTPIRQSLLKIKKDENDQDGNQEGGFTQFGVIKKLPSQGSSQYQKHILQKMMGLSRESKKQPQNEEEEEDDSNRLSPTFGIKIQRKHTFGPYYK